MEKIKRVKELTDDLHPVGTQIPKKLLEKFNMAVRIDGRSKRRIFGELIMEFCDAVLPENYDQIKNIIDRE